MDSGILKANGADLYYETRGHGPAVLLIPGAGGDAGLFTDAAEELSDAFRVITYDRRGNSRSTGRTDAPMVLTDQADDAKALIDGLADGQALVFGSSGGGIVALDLCARHPRAVHAAIAHEPPVFNMLADDVPGADFYEQMTGLYRQLGPQAMGESFAGAMGEGGAFTWPEDLLQRFMGNVEYLFDREWESWSRFEPDVDALSVFGPRLVLAGAAANRGLFNSLPAADMASRLGAPWLEFPGVHLEFLVRPQGFAAALRAALTQIFTTHLDMPDVWRVPARV